MKTSFRLTLLSLALFFSAEMVIGQEITEKTWGLPPLLVCNDGTTVRNAKEWEQKRRPELLSLFAKEMYGVAPRFQGAVRYKVLSEKSDALGGIAIRKEVAVYLKKGSDKYMTVLIYIPKQTKGRAPLFCGLNFYGNYHTTDDTDIALPDKWVPKRWAMKGNRAEERYRGAGKSAWPFEMAVKRGYAVATIYKGDIDPDYKEGYADGVRALYDQGGRTSESWAALGAWAFGLSRAMDYFEKEPLIDSRHVAVLGHSRLGKAALWAGATDQRFSLVISNNSGCGGASLSRSKVGESVARINKSFPYWFADNFKKYGDNEAQLPFDQHALIALMAPRLVYVASADKDEWADPFGELSAAVLASPAYRLYGMKGLDLKSMPAVNTPVQEGAIGYHIRAGKHDITEYDWEQYLNFADRHWRGKSN